VGSKAGAAGVCAPQAARRRTAVSADARRGMAGATPVDREILAPRAMSDNSGPPALLYPLDGTIGSAGRLHNHRRGAARTVPTNDVEREELPLSKAAEYLLDECRMVLPGIQALFGFQLIAVFSPGFEQKLGYAEQCAHLGAIGLVVIAVALIMTPAALHRQAGAGQVTARFIRLSTRLLVWSMFPLAISICIEFYLIAHVIIARSIVAFLAGALFAGFILLWVVLPRADALQKRIEGRRGTEGRQT
jgi:hypothetical protein